MLDKIKRNRLVVGGVAPVEIAESTENARNEHNAGGNARKSSTKQRRLKGNSFLYRYGFFPSLYFSSWFLPHFTIA